jgi:Ca-activated chloride channel homolog
VAAGIGLLAVSLAGPRIGTKVREVKREGIDLVIALDVSHSMLAEDVAPNRLIRAKNEIKRLLDDLRGDRVGLVIFAGDAFIQCPLTTDYGALRLFLDVADPMMIPTPGTDFGPALRRAIQAFEASDANAPDKARTRAILFVSDGEDHTSNVSSLLAEARREGVVVMAAGVGETAGVPIPVIQDGRRVGFRQDREGRIVSTRLEEDALQALAAGGGYFRIARTSSTLPEITSTLARFEKTEFASDQFEEYNEQFQWPLALALLFLLGERLVGDRRNARALSTRT